MFGTTHARMLKLFVWFESPLRMRAFALLNSSVTTSSWFDAVFIEGLSLFSHTGDATLEDALKVFEHIALPSKDSCFCACVRVRVCT